MAAPDPTLIVAAGGGLVGGIVLLVRGMGGYGAAARIEDTAVSRIASLAVGEVLVSGIVEPAELTLVSPLQSTTCVYYRAAIDAADGESGGDDFHEERAVGFRVRDDSGEIRVFPRAARFDVPDRYTESSGVLGESPIGLRMRAGPVYGPGAEDREAQIAALLTVRPGGAELPDESRRGPVIAAPLLGGRGRSRRYREARIEPGEIVTVIGRALPFDQLPDPEAADDPGPADTLVDDADLARDLAEARAAGTLLENAEEAWGNAAIPGFGIGRPVRAPELEAGATRPALAATADAVRFERMFHIAPDALILAAATDAPLIVALGAPAAASGRQERRFLVGLLGAIVAIGSAMALAVMLGGGLG